MVVVGPPCLDRLPMNRVLEHDHRRLGIPVNGQSVRALAGRCCRRSRGTARPRPGVPRPVAGIRARRSRNSKITSSARRSKKCPPSTKPASPSSMIRKNGSSAAKSVDVVRWRWSPGRLERSRRGAFRRAKSWKVVGGRPVTFSMSSLGLEPLPEMMVPGQPAEHHRVIGGDEAGRDRAIDPCVRVDVLVRDGSDRSRRRWCRRLRRL